MHSFLPKTWQNDTIWQNHVSEEGFKAINWLPGDQRVQQSLNVTVFIYVNNACPYYLKELFQYASQGKISSRNNYAKLKVPFRKTTMGQKSPYYYYYYYYHYYYYNHFYYFVITIINTIIIIIIIKTFITVILTIKIVIHYFLHYFHIAIVIIVTNIIFTIITILHSSLRSLSL